MIVGWRAMAAGSMGLLSSATRFLRGATAAPSILTFGSLGFRGLRSLGLSSDVALPSLAAMVATFSSLGLRGFFAGLGGSPVVFADVFPFWAGLRTACDDGCGVARAAEAAAATPPPNPGMR